MIWNKSLNQLIFIVIFAVLAGCNDTGTNTTDANPTQKGVRLSNSATLNGTVSLSGTLSGSSDLTAVISPDPTTSVAAQNSKKLVKPSTSADDPSLTQLPASYSVPIDSATGKFTANVPAGNNYSVSVKLSGVVALKSSNKSLHAGTGSNVGAVA